VGAEITFGIRVENVGEVTLVEVPVYDLYEADVLHYMRTNIGSPRISVSGGAGELFWSDITSNFGDLAPRQVVEFTATFRMIAPRSTTNFVRIHNVMDANDDAVPPAQGEGSVETIPVAAAVYRLFAPNINGQPVEHTCPVPGCSIPGLIHPTGLAIHTGLNRLYISSRDTNQLIVLNAHTLAPITTVGTGAEPWDVVINQKTDRVYVSNFASGDVWVYDATSLALLAQVRTGGKPAVMDILPDLDTVAVAVRGLNGVAFIQGLAQQELVGSGGVGPFGVAADPLSQDFTIINRDAGTGRVLYRKDNSWQARGGEITFGEDGDRLVPFEAAFNPANRRLYVIYMQANGLW
jgi:YVTN family beta-propeller protein